MNRIQFAIVPIILLAPAMALACGPSSQTDYMVLGTVVGFFAAAPLLALPIGLVFKFRANIQSWVWSLLILLAAWAGGALSMGATLSVLATLDGVADFQAMILMGGVALLVMTAITMIMYRIRANRVIKARH
jgi:hypothetical protein